MPIILTDEVLAYATPPISAALLLVKALLVILKDESKYVNMTPPRSALLLVKVLLSEESDVDMTPPELAMLLVKVLLETNDDEPKVKMTPPISAA